MAIRISDNTTNRPIPGRGGLPDISTVFGQQVAQPADLPAAPVDYVSNPAAGAEGAATARAAETIGQSIMALEAYRRDVVATEEDTIASAKVAEFSAEMAKRQNALLEEANQKGMTSEELISAQKELRETTWNETVGSINFTSDKVLKHYQKARDRSFAADDIEFDARVVRPRFAAQMEGAANQTINAIKSRAATLAETDPKAAVEYMRGAFAELALNPTFNGLFGAKFQQLIGKSGSEGELLIGQTALARMTDNKNGVLRDIGLDKDANATLVSGLKDNAKQLIESLVSLDPEAKTRLLAVADNAIDAAAKEKYNDVYHAEQRRKSEQREQQQYLFQLAETRIAQLDAKGQLTGSAASAIINEIAKNPAITNDPTALLKLQEFQARTQTTIRKANEAAADRAATKAVQLQMGNPEAVNKDYMQTIAPKLQGGSVVTAPPEIQAQVLQYVQKNYNNTLPAALKRDIEKGLQSQDPAVVQSTARLVETVRRTNPALYADMSKESRQITEFIAAGMPADKAVATTQEMLSRPPAEQEALKDKTGSTRTAMQKDGTYYKPLIDVAKSLPGAQQSTWFGLSTGPAAIDTKSIPPQVAASYDRYYDANIAAGLTPQAATKAAAAQLKRDGLGVTYLNGQDKPTVTLTSFEVMSGAGASRETAKILEDDIRTTFKEIPADAKVIVNPTGRLHRNPVTGNTVVEGVVSYVNKDGALVTAGFYGFDPSDNKAVKDTKAAAVFSQHVARYEELLDAKARKEGLERRGNVYTKPGPTGSATPGMIAPAPVYSVNPAAKSVGEMRKLRGFDPTLWEQAGKDLADLGVK